MQNGCAEPDTWAVSCGGGHTVCHSAKLTMAVQPQLHNETVKTIQNCLTIGYNVPGKENSKVYSTLM